MHLNAGKPLEPFTTIIGKPDYDGLKTKGLGVHAAKPLSVKSYGERSTTRTMSVRRV